MLQKRSRACPTTTMGLQSAGSLPIPTMEAVLWPSLAKTSAWSPQTPGLVGLKLPISASFGTPDVLQVVWTWLRDSLSRATQALPALRDHSPWLHRMLVWYPHLLQGLHTWQQSWTFLNILQDYGPGCRDAIEDLPPHPRPHHGHPCRGPDDCYHALWQEVTSRCVMKRSKLIIVLL